MSCPVITEIDRSEYIGNSLSVINTNFSNLNSLACDDFTRINNLSNQVQNLNNNITNISNTLIPGAARAIVKFDGTVDTNNVISDLFTNRKIYNQYNVLSVYKKGQGDYRVRFIQPFSAVDYLVIGSCNEVINGNNYGWVAPYFFSEEYVDIRITNSRNPQHVSVVVF